MAELDYGIAQNPQDHSPKILWSRRNVILACLCGVVIIFLGAVTFFWIVLGVRTVRLEGSAMEPTIKNGDLLLIARPRNLKRGDIIAFRYPLDPSKTYMKRIVALPGETISIDRGGNLIINGVPFPEPYVAPDQILHPRAVEPTTVPSDGYFVMGDARDKSNDSRIWGPVPRRLIYGVMIARYWRPSDSSGDRSPMRGSQNRVPEPVPSDFAR